ncbi:MAG: hypothetical protein ABJZ55_10040 [Fuerstiella sp.]
MITPTLLIWMAFFSPVSIAINADSQWDYTKEGSVSVSEERAGRAGKFRTFHCTTNDSTEKVAQWYAKRLGPPDKHSLVIAAREGFSKLENDTIIKTGYGHDTEKRKDHTTMLAVLSRQHAHITFLHRPDFAGMRDVSISITSIPGGKTSVVVMQPILGSFRQQAEK